MTKHTLELSAQDIANASSKPVSARRGRVHDERPLQRHRHDFLMLNPICGTAALKQAIHVLLKAPGTPANRRRQSRRAFT